VKSLLVLLQLDQGHDLALQNVVVVLVVEVLVRELEYLPIEVVEDAFLQFA
jgi:hypothetical protein